MKALEMVVLRIYIPYDEAHLERVLETIQAFRPYGDVNVFEHRSILSKSGKRLPLEEQKAYVVEYYEESCRASIFMDGLHEDLMPCTVIGDYVSRLEGEGGLSEGTSQTENNSEAGN